MRIILFVLTYLIKWLKEKKYDNQCCKLHTRGWINKYGTMSYLEQNPPPPSITQ